MGVRGFLPGIAAALAAVTILAAATPALAQAWPARPIRVIVPFPPGGGLDFFARVLAPRLQDNLGQQIVVENRSGTGGVQHLAGEILKTAAKIDIVHVPYKGAGPAVIDMVGGQVQMGFTALPSSIQHARSGKLRPIAVTSVKRSDAAPELPTFTELGYPALDLVVWYAALFPARTPPEVVAKMSAEINRAVSAADIKARLLEQGVESVGTTPDQLAKFMQSESARYGKIIRDTGAKPD